MGFPALDIVPVDRVNTDEIGTVLVYALRRRIAETIRRAGRPDLVDADFSAGTERAKIPKHQQKSFKHLQTDEFIAEFFKLSFDVAHHWIIFLALEQVTMGKLHHSRFGNPKP